MKQAIVICHITVTKTEPNESLYLSGFKDDWCECVQGGKKNTGEIDTVISLACK